MTSPAPNKFATELLGLTLGGGWRVVEKLAREAGSTGGFWSEGYFVERDGDRRAFLKALDLSMAFADPASLTRALQAMTEAYNDEKAMLERCRARGLNRVVVAIDYGEVQIDPAIPYSVVPYIIFECADGDVRRHIKLAAEFDVRWALRALHHIANGIQQLHRERIAHQDLKPSNVMMFDNGKSAKVGDLGRASQQAKVGQFDAMPIPGDRSYAPPESLYGVPFVEWSDRMGSDAYQLGSMIAFLFTGMSMTALWMTELPLGYRPGAWTGTFSDVLPFVREAFDRAALRVEAQMPVDIRGPMGVMLRRLADPDPKHRGHPRNRQIKQGNPFDLERFVTDLDYLARRADAAFIRHTA
jgi:eukaryotic-like serine/threonine-protein kinase